MPPALVIRPLASPAEFDACVALQRATWGDDFRELVPPAMLLVTQKVGGIAAGAFQGPTLVGFVYGLTGVRDGALVHWSHMLAVAEPMRDRGIGRRLKAWQREQVAALGIERMYWTFDPLVARNAHLNLAVLGARVIEHHHNLYGENPMSRTDSVIGSDRFVVEWALGETAGAGQDQTASDGDELPVVSPDTPRVPDRGAFLVAIPGDIQALKRERPEEARRWRVVTRRAFERGLETGGRVAGVVRRPGTADLCYLITPR